MTIEEKLNELYNFKNINRVENNLDSSRSYFVAVSREGIKCEIRVDSTVCIQIKNNQGMWKVNKKYKL